MTDSKLNAEPAGYHLTGSPARLNVLGNLVERLRGGALGPVRLQATATLSGALTMEGSLTAQIVGPSRIPSQEASGQSGATNYPTILLQAALVNLGDETNDGPLVESVSIAWFEIVRELARNPAFLSELPWRKLEELIAGAYEREGWPEVVLTPRSGDRGRDVIATRPGFGSIRVFDQVKAYAPGYRVSADEVRSLVGALSLEGNVSRGVVTTSAEFAPGISKDPRLSALMPYRLELKDGPQLLEWLTEILDRPK